MKKLVFILGPILAIGAVVALGMLGIINIPGLTPAKPDWKATLLKIYGQKGSIKGDLVVLKDAPKADVDAFLAAAKTGGLDATSDKDGVKSKKLVEWLNKNLPAGKPKTPVVVKAPPLAPPKTEAKKPKGPTLAPEKGEETVAELWNGIEVTKLLEITKGYKDSELAKILLKMDADKVSEFLAALEGGRAAKLSRELQKQASVVPDPNTGA